jgi:hypothetical protein
MSGVRVAVERVRHDAPRFDFAEPDQAPGLARLTSSFDGRHDAVELPSFGPWALVLIREEL